MRKAGGRREGDRAATDDDLANLSIGLAAKRAGPRAAWSVRIFDSTLAEKMRQGLASTRC